MRFVVVGSRNTYLHFCFVSVGCTDVLHPVLFTWCTVRCDWAKCALSISQENACMCVHQGTFLGWTALAAGGGGGREVVTRYIYTNFKHFSLRV